MSSRYATILALNGHTACASHANLPTSSPDLKNRRLNTAETARNPDEPPTDCVTYIDDDCLTYMYGFQA